MKDDERLLAHVRVRLRRGEHLLAAVSGGADSVALLLMLHSFADEGLIRLSAAHFEHGIRGRESLGDMAYVKELCARLDIPLYIGRGDVPAEAKRFGKGLEETARDMRRAFLRETLVEIGADAAALAHHADDQAETVLMRLFRGTGGAGAAGMKERQDIWFRPLLGVRRKALREFLIANGVSWREDSTNLEEITPRNRLRLKVMPVCEEIWPGAVDALARYARLQAEESDFIREKALEWLDGSAEVYAFCVCVDIRSLPHRAVTSAAIKLLMGKDAAFADVERVLSACESGSCRVTVHSERYRCAIVSAGKLWLFDPVVPNDLIPLSMGENGFPGIGSLRLEEAPCIPVRDDPFVQVLDRDALIGAKMRIWHAGDRIRPLGMHGKSRLVSDILSDKKIPAALRCRIPVIEAEDGELLWAVGGAVSERAKLLSGSRAVRLTWYFSQRDIKDLTEDNTYGARHDK